MCRAAVGPANRLRHVGSLRDPTKSALSCGSPQANRRGAQEAERHEPNALGLAVAAACLAIAAHGLVDSFLAFAPTYILFSLTLGLAAACARGVETCADAHRI